jgi:Ni,Fe-hydrogenase maturation factor
MDRLPPHMLVYCIEGEEFEEGTGLSQAVEESVDRVVELVLERVRNLGPRWSALATRNTCVP